MIDDRHLFGIYMGEPGSWRAITSGVIVAVAVIAAVVWMVLVANQAARMVARRRGWIREWEE